MAVPKTVKLIQVLVSNIMRQLKEMKMSKICCGHRIAWMMDRGLQNSAKEEVQEGN